MEIRSFAIPFLSAVALGSLGILLFSLARQRLPFHVFQIGLSVGGMIVLSWTWYVLFWYMTLRTKALLAPWDMWGNLAPPPGDWQRLLNDFFTQQSHDYLPALTVVGISMVLFLVRLIRPHERARRPWLPVFFAVTNVTFLVITFLSIVPLDGLPTLWLPQPRPPIDVGYHRSWPAILATTLLLLTLFWAQHSGSWTYLGSQSKLRSPRLTGMSRSDET